MSYPIWVYLIPSFCCIIIFILFIYATKEYKEDDIQLLIFGFFISIMIFVLLFFLTSGIFDNCFLQERNFKNIYVYDIYEDSVDVNVQYLYNGRFYNRNKNYAVVNAEDYLIGQEFDNYTDFKNYRKESN